MNKILKALLLCSTAVCLICIVGLFMLRSAHTANWDTEPVRINIPQGCDYPALRDTLDAHEVVIHKTPASWEFGMIARALGLNKNVRPGSYLVTRNMNMLKFVRKLRNGQQDPVRLTIGKFRTPDQLNQYLNRKLMHNDFNVTLENFHLILPDTYEVYWTITPEQFMQRMEKENYRFWEGMPTSVHLPPVVAVILASIVEEETNNKSEKPLIASVYINRMEKGMPLQADPTVKYAVGDFTLRRILNKHLQTESPFNTYLHTDLPPAPICLPSKETIRAVVFAPQTNYLYFCASDKLDGTHRFAATLAEHNRNAARFHAALNRRGIR